MLVVTFRRLFVTVIINGTGSDTPPMKREGHIIRAAPGLGVTVRQRADAHIGLNDIWETIVRYCRPQHSRCTRPTTTRGQGLGSTFSCVITSHINRICVVSYIDTHLLRFQIIRRVYVETSREKVIWVSKY